MPKKKSISFEEQIINVINQFCIKEGEVDEYTLSEMADEIIFLRNNLDSMTENCNYFEEKSDKLYRELHPERFIQKMYRGIPYELEYWESSEGITYWAGHAQYPDDYYPGPLGISVNHADRITSMEEVEQIIVDYIEDDEYYLCECQCGAFEGECLAEDEHDKAQKIH